MTPERLDQIRTIYRVSRLAAPDAAVTKALKELIELVELYIVLGPVSAGNLHDGPWGDPAGEVWLNGPGVCRDGDDHCRLVTL